MKAIVEKVLEMKKEGKEKEPLCAYLYDLDRLEEHAKRVTALLPPRCRMFYAMKANSERPILETLAPWVHGFETASLGEVEKARAIGSDIPVIFGGPGKTDAEIEGALRLKVERLHVESLQELLRVEHVAARLGKTAAVLLRVNLKGPFPSATLQMAGRPTQFGIDEDEVATAVMLSKDLPHVRLEGFHFHSLSNNLDYRRHLDLLDLYRERVSAWEKAFGIRVSALDAGGGIGVNYADPERQFDWERFAEELGKRIRDHFPSSWERIDFECGRFLTAACGYYAAEVLDIKRNHGTDYVVIRGGTHHFRLPASWQHSHPFEVVPVEGWPHPYSRKEIRDRRITVVGQLCTPKDVLAREVPVSRIRIGDVILFRYAGAYGWSISHHDFLSHPHPEHVYIRRREPERTGHTKSVRENREVE